MKIDLKPNEVVVKAGNTNRSLIDKLIDGKLIVTNQRIYFKTIEEENHKFNLEIIPRDIKELHYYNTKWIFPNGLNILTKDGDEIRFVIKNREEWAKVINKMY